MVESSFFEDLFCLLPPEIVGALGVKMNEMISIAKTIIAQ
jgi:hypothetical protein